MFRWSVLICLLLVLFSGSILEADECGEIIPAGTLFAEVDLDTFRPLDSPKKIEFASRFIPRRYTDLVQRLAGKHGVSWQLVAALIKEESNFRTKATSPRGARGLMQLTPRTASRYKVAPDELYDPHKNVEAGVMHLKMLIDRYSGNLELAIAAYNTGEFAVDRYRGIPPFRTTRSFVKKVLSQYLNLL